MTAEDLAHNNNQYVEYQLSKITLALQQLRRLKDVVRNPSRSKSAKEEALRQVRAIERELGLEGKPYNKRP